MNYYGFNQFGKCLFITNGKVQLYDGLVVIETEEKYDIGEIWAPNGKIENLPKSFMLTFRQELNEVVFGVFSNELIKEEHEFTPFTEIPLFVKADYGYRSGEIQVTGGYYDKENKILTLTEDTTVSVLPAIKKAEE